MVSPQSEPCTLAVTAWVYLPAMLAMVKSPQKQRAHSVQTVVLFWARKWPSLGVVLLEVLLFGNHSRPHFVFLRHVKGLRGLYLNQNYIGPEGCKCLGRPKILPGMHVTVLSRRGRWGERYQISILVV